jgi:hypothetical protein
MRKEGLLIVLALMLPASDASAQRGGQHLNSPGYQRALIESRKPQAEPAPPTATPRKKRLRRTPAQ